MDREENITRYTTCLSFYSSTECQVALISRIICSASSLLGSIFLISVICLFRKYKRLHFRLLLYIAICSFFNSLTILFVERHDSSNSTWCRIKGLSLQFNAWGILMWQFCLTINMFLNIVSTRLSHSTRLIESIYHILSWGVSLVASIIPLVHDQYGPAITWCWIKDHRWKVWAFYFEYVVIILIIFVLYAKVVWTVMTLKAIWREHPSQSHRYKVYKKSIRPMMLYPLAILLVSVFPIVYRSLTFFDPDRQPHFTLAFFHIVSVPLWGTLFAVVYVLDPETRQDLNLLNIKNTIYDRLYGSGIREVTLSDHGKPKTPAASGTTQSAATDRGSTISEVSIEPTTVYPNRSFKK